MYQNKDILVVGGGVFGAATALELRRRGHTVSLLDPGPLPHPDASSTDISKVVRMDYGGDAFYMRMMERALEGWRRWNDTWDATLFHESGFLMLTRSTLESGTYEGDSYALLVERGIPVERLSPTTIAENFPAWASGGYNDGYYNPQGGWAESGKVVAALIAEGVRAGVEVLEAERVLSLQRTQSRISGVVTERGELKAGKIILAAGAWTPALLPELKGHIWPIAQPVFHLQAPDVQTYQPPSFPTWSADVASTGWYGFPALEDGTLKIANHGPGLRVEPSSGVDATDGREADFRCFINESLLGLSQARLVRTRTCYYADSWDGDFYITAPAELSGIFVASGGSGHALKFAPLLGGWIADAVEGRDNPDPRRFSWRTPGNRRTEDARHLET